MTPQLTQLMAQQHAARMLRAAEIERVARHASRGAPARDRLRPRVRRLLASPAQRRRAAVSP